MSIERSDDLDAINEQDLDRLNEAVARKLGWEKNKVLPDITGIGRPAFAHRWRNGEISSCQIPADYARDIAAAWEIAEKLEALLKLLGRREMNKALVLAFCCLMAVPALSSGLPWMDDGPKVHGAVPGPVFSWQPIWCDGGTCRVVYPPTGFFDDYKKVPLDTFKCPEGQALYVVFGEYSPILAVCAGGTKR